ncbi:MULTISPECIES: peroxiredoxin [Cyanophyceae]|uniref:peroxiredoxin n=1 Tax=Cyanophyceae TaxID=3028117 RepID=UPI001688476E|nr:MULTISPECIES: peroxiredoxin [Cyanophyceae]MBD1914745.1 peroxiredoxin [Phormidium sp. FACHB-77]MBD2030848.1 peroxiredoxin [Phormidium sp. FACHB-322]MBD2052447.1 peroxiredoxin [Leptolyngbya sp. FACHB-60]
MNRRRLLRAALGLCLAWLGWMISPAPALALGGTQIPIGELAPEFKLPTNAGDGEIALADFRNQWVVLYFYPRDFTSGCTIEAQRFERDIAEYKARNAQIVGISADSVESHAEFCDSEGLEFPLLSDPKGAVSKAYGSWLGAMSMRHTYIIGPDGTMQARFLGVQPVIHSQEVLAALDELQAKS